MRKADNAPPSEKTVDVAGYDHRQEDLSTREPAVLSLAQPADTVHLSQSDIAQTAKEYLRSIHPGHFSTVTDIPSSRFGAADLMLRNKRKYHILCGIIQGERTFSQFLAEALGYVAWLEEGLSASRVFLRKSPWIFSYLFCKHFPLAGRPFVEQFKSSFPMFLVQYHVLQIPRSPSPSLYFQTVFATNDCKEPLEDPKENHLEIAEDEWRRFNRMKEHALEE